MRETPLPFATMPKSGSRGFQFCERKAPQEDQRAMPVRDSRQAFFREMAKRPFMACPLRLE
jgi:hypothetical protein